MIQKINHQFLSLLILFSCTQMLGRVISIKNNQDFEKFVLQAKNPVVLKFSADWCGVCTSIQDDFEKIAKEKEFATITFAQISNPDFPKISKKYGIIGIPTFVYFKEGNVLGQDVGVQNIDDFQPELRKNIKTKFDPSHKQKEKEAIKQKAHTFFATERDWLNWAVDGLKEFFTSSKSA